MSKPPQTRSRKGTWAERALSLEWFFPPQESDERVATTFFSVFNLVSTMMGGGVLSLPYAFSLAGVVLGPLMLIACALGSDFSLYILISGSRRTGATSYGEVVRVAFGRKMEVFTNVLVFLLTYLACLGYMCLIRDNTGSLVSLIMGKSLSSTEENIVLACCVLCILPITFFRNLHALRFSCIISFCSICLLTCCVGYRSFASPHPAAATDGVKLVADSLYDAIKAFPLVSLSFLCHFNAIPMHNNLRAPTRRKVKRVLHFTVGTAAVIYSLVGFFGYNYARQLTKDDILLNFAATDVLITLGRVALTVTVMLGLPLIVLPCRTELRTLFSILSGKSNEVEVIDDEEQLFLLTDNNPTPPAAKVGITKKNESSSGQPADMTHYLITVGIVASQLAIAFMIGGVSTVWSILGSTVGILVAFLLPSASYLVIRKKKPFERRKLAACLLLVFGSIAFVVCTTVAVYGLVV